jgi:hypothetical protein
MEAGGINGILLVVQPFNPDVDGASRFCRTKTFSIAALPVTDD